MAAPQAAPRRRSWLAGLGERIGSALTARPAVALACAALLVGLGVGAGLLVAGGDDAAAPAGQVVALERFDDGPVGASGTATVARLDGVREVTLDTRGLEPSPDGTSYEVWMIRDADDMVGLGTLQGRAGGPRDRDAPGRGRPGGLPGHGRVDRARRRPGGALGRLGPALAAPRPPDAPRGSVRRHVDPARPAAPC